MAETLPTYYDVLRVDPCANAEGIRRAYRRLAQQYHPDRLPGNANATRAMAAINAAYAVLSDTEQRARHDLWIQRAQSRPAPLVPVQQHTRWQRSWPWYLLFATLTFTLVALLAAALLTANARTGARMPSSAEPRAQHHTPARAENVRGNAPTVRVVSGT